MWGYLQWCNLIYFQVQLWAINQNYMEHLSFIFFFIIDKKNPDLHCTISFYVGGEEVLSVPLSALEVWKIKQQSCLSLLTLDVVIIGNERLWGRTVTTSTYMASCHHRPSGSNPFRRVLEVKRVVHMQLINIGRRS